MKKLRKNEKKIWIEISIFLEEFSGKITTNFKVEEQVGQKLSVKLKENLGEHYGDFE